MKLALISDVHANLEALEAVLAAIAAEGVDLILHLGDLVGYNANPNECVALIRERGILCVAGNHDRAVIDARLAQDFNLIAYQALIWSREQLTPDHKAFLQQLPLTLTVADRFLACHGTPTSPDAYISLHFQGKRVLNQLRRDLAPLRICFFGHTHRRALWCRDVRGKVFQVPLGEGVIPLDPQCHYLLNPGSVGQPRNHLPLASYAVFDTETYAVSFRLVPYNIDQTQKKILAANLPPYLAERLASGI